MYCETVGDRGVSHEPYRFKVAYDKLVIASGAEPLTFGIKGVEEHAFFLREVQNAQEIRKKLLMNLMVSETPGYSPMFHRLILLPYQTSLVDLYFRILYDIKVIIVK